MKQNLTMLREASASVLNLDGWVLVMSVCQPTWPPGQADEDAKDWGIGRDTEEARRHFERWRKNRSGPSRIPEPLRTLAVEAARKHGVNPTARCLHLGFNNLKWRLQAASTADNRKPKGSKLRSRGSSPRRRLGPAFLELLPPSIPPVSASPCTIEVENAQGVKMRIHLASREAVDLVGLIGGLGNRKR